MKKIVNIILCVLAIAMIASIVGCGQQQTPASSSASISKPAQSQGGASVTPAPAASAGENFNADGYPIVNEQITLNIATKRGSVPTDHNDHPILKTVEELTNIDMVFEIIPDDGFDEKMNLYFAANTLPDVICNALTASALVQQGTLGQMIPQNDLIESYMPNLKEILTDNPNIKSTITAPDGNIYSLFIYDGPPRRLCGGFKMILNYDWLDKLNLSVPSTTEEFYEVLKAFRDGDPNGNGKADEIPMLDKWTADGNNFMRLASPWGVTAFYYIDEDTKVPTAGYAADGFKEALKYINRLYSERLIDQELFTMTRAQYQAKAGSPDAVYGADIDHMPGTNMGANAPQYDYIPPLSVPGGEKMWYYQNSASVGVGRWCITTSNKYPRESARLADYFYSLTGSMQVDRGVEGVNWVYNSSGVPELLPTPEGMSYVQFKDHARAEGFPSCIYTKGREYIQNEDLTAEDKYSMENYVVYKKHDFLPSMLYTLEDSERIANIQATLHPYRDEMIAKFVVGEEDIDANWDQYIQNMKNMGLDELLTIYNDRYQLFLKS